MSDHEYHDRIVQMHKEGISQRKIGRALGVSESVVRRVLHRAGMAPPLPAKYRDIHDEVVRRYEAGQSQKSIAVDLRTTPRRVRKELEEADRLDSGADRSARPLARNGTAGTRPCMCCGKSFASQGSHNRMCTECRCRQTDPTEHVLRV